MAKDAATHLDAYSADMRKALTDGAEQYSAKVEEMAEFAKGNMDAFFASAAKATESAQEMTNAMLGFTRASIDANMAAVKELSAVKDANEFVEKQNAFAKASAESLSAHVSKINEMTMAAMKECAEPMSARFSMIGEIVKDGAGRA